MWVTVITYGSVPVEVIPEEDLPQWKLNLEDWARINFKRPVDQRVPFWYNERIPKDCDPDALGFADFYMEISFDQIKRM